MDESAGSRTEMSDEEREGEKRGSDGEEYANDKVWLAVGGISSSRGNMCGNKLSTGIH